MNRIEKLFEDKKRDGGSVMSIYFPAGYPSLDSTVPTLKMLQSKGVDLVEVGIPFSDPLVDGPVIQLASKSAMDNGINLDIIFAQLKEAREGGVTIPIILMGYWNSVYKFGVERFLEQCKDAGVDGVILPDLPLEEYKKHYSDMFNGADVLNILLVTPETTDKRLQFIVNNAEGFIYMVSSSATTGGQLSQTEERDNYFKKVAAFDVSSLIGFGIHDRGSFEQAASFSDGAIIGTAFIKALEENRADSFIDSLIVD